MQHHLSSDDADGDFLKLFIRHENALRAYARMLLPTWDAIDDVIQNGSIVMWKKFSQLDSPENFLPWAKVVIRFEALRYRRTKARDRHVFRENCYERIATEDEEDPGNLEQELRALRKCLARFKPEYKELILARYSGQERLKQIAQARGQTPNSIYKLLHRLRKKLGKCIEATLAETPENA